MHGALHAQGYDHENPAEAEEMEGIETAVLAELGFPIPTRTADIGSTDPAQRRPRAGVFIGAHVNTAGVSTLNQPRLPQTQC